MAFDVDDKKVKTFDEKLENADIEDMFAQVYPAFAPITDPALNDDPGRFRNDAFLKKLYQDELPFAQIHLDTLKAIMVDEQTATYTLRAKTGWAVPKDRKSVV